MSDSSPAVRVLHLHSGNMIGGVESMLLTIGRSGHLCPELQSEFALTFDDVFASELRKSSPVHLLPQARLRHLPSIYQSRTHLRALLQERSFQAVISHSSWIQLLYADVVRRSGLPIIFWMHSAFDGHWLQKLASFQRPDFVICNSSFTRASLERCYPRVPNRVIYCPVATPTVAADSKHLRESLGTKADEAVVFMAARMQPWKGHANLLQALSRLKIQKSWRAWIAGGPNNAAENAYLESLQRQAQTLGLAERVMFLGQRDDTSSLMAAADIYSQPNEQPEPFGVVFVEALHAGVPVVTFSTGGAREILDQSTGILLPARDLEALAAALGRLIDDPGLRAALGSAGPPRAQTLCDPATQMHILNQTVRTVISSAGGVTAR